MSNGHWPMFDIRLVTPDLVLRPVTEADLGALCEILPDGAEQNPASTTYAGLTEPANRAVILHQDYWRALGTWRPESWELGMAVFHGDELIGFQGLEGDDFARLRTVDSSSWLTEAARGQGFGKQMRAAVLALAFGPLGARFAITSAWDDNAASLGVSRALGYQDNGVTADRRGDGAGEMVHLRLTRERWLASPWPARVRVPGMDRCLPFFGLE